MNRYYKPGEKMGHPEFEKVVKIIEKLRDPNGGCPWDLKQTHQSLARYLIEEAYEFHHATLNNDKKELEDEIGDVLLQVILHCTIGQESGDFNLESVSKNLGEKMIRRHPHVFNNDNNEKISESEVKKNWEKIKAKERKSSHMKDLGHLPSLLAAHKIGEKTQRVGFDWGNPQEVVEVVQEELQEFLDEIPEDPTKLTEHMREEYGDLLFSMAQLGRHLGMNAEEELHSANKKFIRRYNQMRDLMNRDGADIEIMNQKEMDLFWKRVKELE